MSTPHDAELAALALGEIDADDEQVLHRIAALYDGLDPVPGGLVDRIAFGITLDALHAEIAEMERSAGLAGVRSDSATETQTITFTSASLSLMITISPTSTDRVRIDGWAAPGGGVTVELRSTEGTATRVADADGRFVFDDVPRGLAQFVVRQPGADPRPPVVTPSLEI
jgi:hypothetical protein